MIDDHLEMVIDQIRFGVLERGKHQRLVNTQATSDLFNLSTQYICDAQTSSLSIQYTIRSYQNMKHECERLNNMLPADINPCLKNTIFLSFQKYVKICLHVCIMYVSMINAGLCTYPCSALLD